jgi:hypothetical protein
MMCTADVMQRKSRPNRNAERVACSSSYCPIVACAVAAEPINAKYPGDKRMTDIYNGPGEEEVSLDVIESLAEQTHRPVPEVMPVYEAELRHLKAEARITDYVRLFAVRRTREALLRGRA